MAGLKKDTRKIVGGSVKLTTGVGLDLEAIVKEVVSEPVRGNVRAPPYSLEPNPLERVRP